MKTISTNDFIKLSVFFNVAFVGIVFALNYNFCGAAIATDIIFLIGLTTGFVFNGLMMVLNFWPHLLTYKPKMPTKVKDLLPKPKPTTTPAVVANTEIPDITASTKSPYLQPVAKPANIKVAGKDANLYQFSDIRFDFHRLPHILLAGTSGSGKTVALFNILGTIKRQYPMARFVVIDYGNQDFEQTYPTDLTTFLKVTEAMFLIMKGRQLEGKQTDRTRIVWIVEEFESVLGEIKLEPKTAQTAFYVRLANIGRMARKLSLNMVFVTQSAKAEDLNTSIRNNFANRFIMAMENNSLAGALGCNYDVGSLPTGVGYSSAVKAFIKFPMAKEPPLELIPYTDLMRLANYYKVKYNLIVDEDNE